LPNIDLILNSIDEVLEEGVSVPLTGGKSMVDAERIRELIDDIRLNMPTEIKQAKAVVADRNEILSLAKKEAENLIRKAEERARTLVDSDTIVRQANAKGMAMLSEASQKAATLVSDATEKANELTSTATAKANETITQANIRAKEMKQAAYDFSEAMLRATEEALEKSLEEVKATRKALTQTARESIRQSKQIPLLDE